MTKLTARRIADIYGRWGRGVHSAGLYWGDCFSYDVAMQFGCPLLFVGEDFSKTDVLSALIPTLGTGSTSAGPAQR